MFGTGRAVDAERDQDAGQEAAAPAERQHATIDGWRSGTKLEGARRDIVGIDLVGRPVRRQRRHQAPADGEAQVLAAGHPVGVREAQPVGGHVEGPARGQLVPTGDFVRRGRDE
jgi:hypothetical protein